MLVSTNLSVSGSLSLSSVAPTTTSLSAMILESGLVKSRNLGSMSLKGDNEYLPQISLSFPNIFNLNTSTLNFANQSLTVSLTNQPAKTFLAAPNNLAGTPSFRAILASDIPTLNQDTTGNAATATALQTARTLTIGNTGKSFDGSGNVSWSLAEIGAQSILTNPITGTGTTNYALKFLSGGVVGDSLIYDDGTNVGIGTTSPSEKLDVSGYVNATGFKTPSGTTTQALTADGGVFDLNTKLDKGTYTGTAQDLKNDIENKQEKLSSFDESILIEFDGNIEGNVSLFTEYFEQQVCELNFIPTQIIGVYQDGIKLLPEEFNISLPKTITITTYSSEKIEIQYTHLKNN